MSQIYHKRWKQGPHFVIVCASLGLSLGLSDVAFMETPEGVLTRLSSVRRTS